MYILPVSFGRDTLRRWSVLRGVYVGGNKSPRGNGILTLVKDNSETNPLRNIIIRLYNSYFESKYNNCY